MYKLVRDKDAFRIVQNKKSAVPSDYMRNSQYQRKTLKTWKQCSEVERRVWKKFVDTGHTDRHPGIGPIIQSWRRCREAGVEPTGGRCFEFLPESELENRKARLIDICGPIIDTLYQCVRGSDFMIVLVDGEGYILKSLGDYKALKQAEKLTFGPGANWRETSVGTNAIGTALALGKAIQVTGPEHYCETHHLWTCAATPVRDPYGAIIGCLDISGPRENCNFHTLGMVAAAVRSIEERLRVEHFHEHLQHVNKQMGAILNSVSDGIVLVDASGRIMSVNAAAAHLVDTLPSELAGVDADSVFRIDGKFKAFMNSGKPYCEEQLQLPTPRGPFHCLATARPVCNEHGFCSGAVFTFSRLPRTPFADLGKTEGPPPFTFKDIVGESPAIRSCVRRGLQVARSPSTVLLQGESGTGKELFARAIHNAGDRSDGPFVSLNCGAIPSELIQSELFGYCEGAFTGARKGGRKGKLEAAHRGILFLDEIGDMPWDMQVNLLRALEEKTVLRVGGDKPVPVDVRIVAATNRNLREEVARGRFREDLFYRLNVISMTIPPLRERGEDTLLLARHHIEQLSRKLDKRVSAVDPEVYEILGSHAWPGNVRELIHVLEHAVNVMEGDELCARHLPDYLKSPRRGLTVEETMDEARVAPLSEVEKQAVEKALELCRGNITQAARILGIGRNTLYDKIRKHGIRVSP